MTEAIVNVMICYGNVLFYDEYSYTKILHGKYSENQWKSYEKQSNYVRGITVHI